MDVRSIVKKHLVPHIRELGFQGSFPHFRRVRNEKKELVSFQFDKYGSGRFVVEVAVAPGGIFKTYWGKEIPQAKLTARDLIKRLRLGSSSESEDFWFEFGDDPRSVANKVIQLLETQGDNYFKNGGA